MDNFGERLKAALTLMYFFFYPSIDVGVNLIFKSMVEKISLGSVRLRHIYREAFEL